MRLFLQKIIAFFMLGVIFTVSTGMGFIEHSCQMKEEKAIFLTKKKSCCTAKKSCAHSSSSQTTLRKAKCCEDKNIYVHVDMAGYSQKVQKFFSNTFIAVVQNFFTWVQSLYFPKKDACQYTNTSPPQTGRETLTKKSTLQI